MRLFTLCTYLKTKESYDRWITRRLWGFRQQISKAKYLRMSVGNIRKLQENTVALYTERKNLQVSAIRGSGYVWPEKLKRPPLPSGCEISGCKMLKHRISDVKCRRTEFWMWNVDARNSGCEMLAHGILPQVDWAMLRKGDRLRVQGVGTPLPDDTECAWLSGSTPSGFPKRTCGTLLYPNSLREKHTALVNITPRR